MPQNFSKLVYAPEMKRLKITVLEKTKHTQCEEFDKFFSIILKYSEIKNPFSFFKFFLIYPIECVINSLSSILIPKPRSMIRNNDMSETEETMLELSGNVFQLK